MAYLVLECGFLKIAEKAHNRASGEGMKYYVYTLLLNQTICKRIIIGLK